jgi:16S rRNA (uracil1498-N3)-methyltransferase
MNYFFHPETMSEGDNLLLTDEESRHAIKVLRLKKGNSIQLINGLGQSGEGEIKDIAANCVSVMINDVISEKKPDHEISVALAMLKKKDRLEWFIEKAVELAATKIFIFNSQHTEKSNIDAKRLNKISVSALKQSGNLWMPEIIGGLDFRNIISASYQGSKFIAHCRDEQKQLLRDAYHASQSAIVLIGPEGDFSEPEIKQSYEHGFVPVGLGNLRLRAETAALTALLTMQIANQ